MKKEYFPRHQEAIAARYGIENVNSFRRSARRYECRLNWLNELVCGSARWADWAGQEREKVQRSAVANLSKYCRNRKLFAHDMFINQDPRGYALKLHISKPSRRFLCCVDRDCGDYFIVAPELK